MVNVVVVKFKRSNKPYYFGTGKFQFKRGQGVVVETARGLEYAIVEVPLRTVEEKALVAPLKSVIRPASKADDEAFAANEARRPEAIRLCKEKAAEHGLNMKIIGCEFAFDGSKVVFTFTSEGRVDFRDLVRDLASVFHKRIELRQVGTRDEARILGGLAPCGRTVCCAGGVECQKVGVKMAKTQGLSINPGKISGLCGRLMCCLAFENDYYAGVSRQVPKAGAAVSTPEGKGIAVSSNMLKMTVLVKIEKEGGGLAYRTFPLSEVKFHRASSEEAPQEK